MWARLMGGGGDVIKSSIFGGKAAESKKASTSFLKKRSKKFLVRLARCKKAGGQNYQSFFASFCSQKEVLSSVHLFFRRTLTLTLWHGQCHNVRVKVFFGATFLFTKRWLLSFGLGLFARRVGGGAVVEGGAGLGEGFAFAD
jgi:hypothetical protein